MSNDKNQILKKEIEIKFVSDLSREYQINQSVFHLPLTMNVNKLNELINKLLNLSPNKIFSFFIGDIKLLGSLNDFVNENNITTEQQIEIYYMFEIPEPEKSNTIKEDEWIKKISILNEMNYNPSKHNEYIVGLFNGEVSFYNGNNNNKIYSLKNCNNVDEDALALLTDIKYFKRKESENKILIRTLRNSLNTFEIYDIDSLKQNQTLLCSNEKINDEYFNCIDINPLNYNIFAMGGTMDNKGIIQIFNLPENLSLNETKKTPNKKKRKINSIILNPTYTFNEVHYSQCNHITFLDGEYLITGGDDYNINIYNIITNNLFMTLNTFYKDISSICKVSNKTFLIGYQDGTIKFYDINDSNLNKNKASLIFKDNEAYCGFISDISLCNDKENHPNTFVTSNYDSNIKVWDIRGGKLPLYKVNTGETEKNFSVLFNGIDTIISGGDGSLINIYNY
jgi:WD40 repeat protein